MRNGVTATAQPCCERPRAMTASRRFATSSATPVCDANRSCERRSSMRRVSWSATRSSSRYVASTFRTPAESLDAMSSPSCRANGSSSSCGTTWFTSPHTSAVGASRKFPVTLISRARRWPIASASSTVSPHPGMIPTRACVSAKRARSDATRKSQVSATSKPPVTAAPLTAPITGLVVTGKGRISSSASLATTWRTSESLLRLLRSTPAQNAGSAPVRTMASTSSRASHAAIVSGSAAVRAGSSAFRASGRLRVTTATRSLTSVRITFVTCSPSRPSGLALLEECGHAFADVVAGDDGRGRVGCRRPAELVALGDGALERAQAGASADRSDRADPLRQCERARHRAAGFGDHVHEPECMRALGGQAITGEQQLPGHVERQRARRAEQPTTGGDEPALDLGQPERRRARRHHEIAGEHDLEPAAERGSLDRGDQRLLAVAPDDAVLAAALGACAPALRAGQVAPGREHRRRPGDDSHPELGVVVEPVERGADAVGDRLVDRVALLLALDAHDEHALVDLRGHAHRRGSLRT